jgi:hypothetical protein
VLRNPDEFRPLGRAAEKMIVEQYSLEAVLPKMLALYEEARQMPAEPARPIKVAATVMPGPSRPRPAVIPPTRPLPPSATGNAEASKRSPFRG